MKGSIELYKDARTVASPAAGHIIRLDELRDGFYSKRRAGDGFAIRPLLLSFPQRMTELMRLGDISVFSPVSGAVTELAEDRISLRTGDNLSISLHLGSIDGIEWSATLGSVLRKGDAICRFRREAALDNGFGGAVLTLFTQPLQISELHVDTGFRFKGDRVAFFRLR